MKDNSESALSMNKEVISNATMNLISAQDETHASGMGSGVRSMNFPCFCKHFARKVGKGVLGKF